MASSEDTFATPADANRTSTSVEHFDQFLRRHWKEVCTADAGGIASRPEEIGSMLAPGQWASLFDDYIAKRREIWIARTGGTAGPEETFAARSVHRLKASPEEILTDPMLAALHDAFKASVNLELLEYTYDLRGWWKEKFEMIPREGEIVLPRKKVVVYGVPDRPSLISTEMQMHEYLEAHPELEQLTASDFEWGNIADDAGRRAVYEQALKLSSLQKAGNRRRSKGSSSTEGFHRESSGIARMEETLTPSLATLHDAYKASVSVKSLESEFHYFSLRLSGCWKEVYDMIPREGRNVPWKRVVVYWVPGYRCRPILSRMEMDAYWMAFPTLPGSVMTPCDFEWGNIADDAGRRAVYEQAFMLSKLPEPRNSRRSNGCFSTEVVHKFLRGMARMEEPYARFLATLHDAYKVSVCVKSLESEFHQFYLRFPGWAKEVFEMIPREGEIVPWKKVVLYRVPDRGAPISSEMEMVAYLMAHPSGAGYVLNTSDFEWGNIADEAEKRAVFERALKLSKILEPGNRRRSKGSSSVEGVHEDLSGKSSMEETLAPALDTVSGGIAIFEETCLKLTPAQWARLFADYEAKWKEIWSAPGRGIPNLEEISANKAMAKQYDAYKAKWKDLYTAGSSGIATSEEILADPALATLDGAYKGSVTVELLEYTYNLRGWWKEKFEMIPREGEIVLPRKKVVVYGVPDRPSLISTEMQMHEYLEAHPELEHLTASDFEWGNIADEAEKRAVYEQALKLSKLPEPGNRRGSKGSCSTVGVQDDTEPKQSVAKR